MRLLRSLCSLAMTAILDGILNEIAPSALLPRNDAGNFRIPHRDPLKGLGDGIVGNSRIFVIASEAKQSLGILDFLGNFRFLLGNSRI